MPYSDKYYLIVKGASNWDGQIVPLHFDDVVELVMCREFRWTQAGCQVLPETP